MATLAETLVNAAIDSTDPSKAPDFAGHFAQGAQLAQHAQQLQMQQQEMDMKKQELQQAKLEKFVNAVEKGQQYAGKAQTNYYNKFLPAYKKSLGPDIDKMIPDDSLNFITMDPINMGRFQTLVADVREGRSSAQDALAKINDPVEFGDVTPTMNTAVQEAQKTFLGNQAQMVKTQMTQTGANQRQQTEIAATPRVTLSKKVADEYANYQAEGGKASADAKLKMLDDAAKQLESGKIQTGTAKTVGAGLLGDKGQALINPELKQLMDNVRGAVQLKKALDSQFSAKEADIVMNRAFDPNLPGKANAAKIRKVYNELKADIQNKEKQFSKQGFDVGATKTYNIGGADRSAEEAKAFYTAHPEYLKDKPDVKKELGL